MSNTTALLIKDGLPFGKGTLGKDGDQVLIPVITDIEWKAAPKRGHGVQL